MILTVALALAQAPQKQVLFKGTIQGLDVHLGMPSPGIGLLGTSGTGIGTLFGQFSFDQKSTVNLANGTLTGSGHWIAANGDSIDTTVVGSPVPVSMAPCQVVGAQPEDSYAKVTEIHTMTGGTGRFAGVQGGFTLTLYHDVVPRSDGTNGTCGSYSGTITPPGAAH